MDQRSDALDVGAGHAHGEAPTAGTVRGLGDRESSVLWEYATAALYPATSSGSENLSSATSENLISAPAAASADQERKAFATLQASAALRGFRLDRLEAETGGSAYVITRWALTKQLQTLDDVCAFLAQIRARMQAEHGINTESAARTAWEQYRAACFIRPGPFLAWLWSAADDFDFAVAGMHLAQVPGARFELGTHAIALVLPHLADPDLHEWHLVPLTRLRRASLEAIQPAAAGNLMRRVDELRVEQRAAQELLAQRVKQANLWRLLPGSGNGTIQ